METLVLKLGGALITDKKRGVFDRARMDLIDRIAGEIAESLENRRLILVHGAGSFGHPYVEKYGKDDIGRNPYGVSDTHLACERLCELVCRAMLNYGLSPAPVHPFSCFSVIERAGKEAKEKTIVFDRTLFSELIEDGFIPVTHGDIVRCKNAGCKGWTVLSGDDIAVELAVHFGVKRIGFATNTQLIVNGRKVDEYSLSSCKAGCCFERKGNVSDVTGGMAGKLEKIRKAVRSSEVFIFSGLKRGSISAFIRGEWVGTKIVP